MSARFTTNFVVLLFGAGLVTVTFAFAHGTAGWVALGVGSAAVVAAAHNFALPDQGVYHRTADVAIAALGAWTIVAAQVMSSRGRWLEFSAGLALSALGAIGLVVREAHLRRRLDADPADAPGHGRPSTAHGDAGARS